MNTNNISQINFNGGFRFTNMPVETKVKLPNLINKGKMVFEDFEKQGDVFFVTRNSYDEKVMQFIKENNLDFEYYSSINTDLPVQYNPQKLSQILSELKEVPIKTISAMKEVLVNRKIQRIQAHSPEHVTNILKSLCIDNKNPAEYYQGGRRIVDPEFSRTIFISPESKHGMYYVKVKPKCKNQESERYMMDKNGNILAKMSTPDAIRLFERRCSELFVK